MNINKTIKQFRSIIPTINMKYRPFAKQVIKQFSDRKIEKTKEAEKLLDQLGSRGLAPQSAIKKLTDKYSKAVSATGKLSRQIFRPIPIKSYMINSFINSNDIYNYMMKKTGVINKTTTNH